jgi:hypothetical protein
VFDAPPPPPPTAIPASTGPARSQQVLLLAVALAPLALLVFLLLASPAFLEPFADERVAIAGLALGLWIVGLLALLTTIAVGAAIFVRNTLAAVLVVVVLASVAFWVVVLGPATVLIVINLET